MFIKNTLNVKCYFKFKKVFYFSSASNSSSFKKETKAKVVGEGKAHTIWPATKPELVTARREERVEKTLSLPSLSHGDGREEETKRRRGGGGRYEQECAVEWTLVTQKATCNG